ncbi:MAG: DUF2156 domain-containing protein [Melioribacteraceae bacterium]|nr:DUF2156 domain-containing protein [Melioribacteraceae bacterium]
MQNKLQEFYKYTTHSNEPKLKNLFYDNIFEGMSFFVFYKNNNFYSVQNWLGAILLSQNSSIKLHTELLLRRKDAPVGIMEALIFEIFNTLDKSGFSELSLGEVPFVESDIGISLQNIIFIKTGKLLNFAYNYNGLFNFKNKFNPEWNNLFLCGFPKITIWDLFNLSVKSNFLSLVIKKSLRI